MTTMTERAIAEKFLGDEPSFDPPRAITSGELVHALNWYRQMEDYDDAKKHFKTWLKENKYPGPFCEKVSTLPNVDKVCTVGFITRLLSRGAILPEPENTTYRSMLSELVFRLTIENPKLQNGEPWVETVHDRVKAQANAVIAHLEERIDKRDFVFDLKDALVGMKGVHVKFLRKWCTNQHNEFMTVWLGEDKDVKEGYSNYSRTHVGEILHLLEELDFALDDIAEEAKANRKPRARKAKPRVTAKKQKKAIDKKKKKA